MRSCSAATVTLVGILSACSWQQLWWSGLWRQGVVSHACCAAFRHAAVRCVAVEHSVAYHNISFSCGCNLVTLLQLTQAPTLFLCVRTCVAAIATLDDSYVGLTRRLPSIILRCTLLRASGCWGGGQHTERNGQPPAAAVAPTSSIE